MNLLEKLIEERKRYRQPYSNIMDFSLCLTERLSYPNALDNPINCDYAYKTFYKAIIYNQIILLPGGYFKACSIGKYSRINLPQLLQPVHAENESIYIVKCHPKNITMMTSYYMFSEKPKRIFHKNFYCEIIFDKLDYLTDSNA